MCDYPKSTACGMTEMCVPLQEVPLGFIILFHLPPVNGSPFVMAS